MFSNNKNLVTKMYSDKYIWTVNGDLKYTKFDNQTTSTYYWTHMTIKRLTKLYFYHLHKHYSSFNLIKDTKISYAGKGYRLYIKKRGFYMQLGYSHKLFVKMINSLGVIMNRYLICLFSTSQNDLNTTVNYLTSFRRINIFTSRGLRSKKNKLFKKMGKTSSY
jgi:ribosomal protein L6P/L9E